MKPGIIILAELDPDLRERILAIQREFDPKLAAMLPPHVTLTGSSGMGPVRPDTPLEELRSALSAIAAATPPMTLRLGRPVRFMQSQVVVLPLNPHGPLRELHDRLLRSGLQYEQPRFTFTPHITLNLFRELPAAELRRLLKARVREGVRIDNIAAYKTIGPINARKLIELPLTGETQ